jgi:Transcription factor WhiB
VASRPIHALTAPVPDLGEAACAESGVLPPSAWTGGGSRIDQITARGICLHLCPVLAACREWAISSRAVPGIAGGLSEAERRQIRRNRKAAAAAAR